MTTLGDGMADTDPTAAQLLHAAETAADDGDREHCVDLLRASIAAHDPDHSARAAAALATVLREQHNLDTAHAVLHDAAGWATDTGAHQVAIALGSVLAARGDTTAAQDLYQHVMAGDCPRHAATAAFALGVLLAGRNDIDGARAAYQAAIDHADTDITPRAAVNLGALLAATGDTDAAATAFHLAADSDNAEQAALARMNLTVLHHSPTEPGPETIGERHDRIVELERHATTLIKAAARESDDRDRLFDIYVALMEIAATILLLGHDDQELGGAITALRGARRIGGYLTRRWSRIPDYRHLPIAATGRLGDLQHHRHDSDAARRWYDRATKAAIRLAKAAPASADGPLHASRYLRLAALTPTTRASNGKRLRRTLEQAAEWGAVGTRREPDRTEATIEECMSRWQLGLLFPQHRQESAMRVAIGLGRLASAGRLAPDTPALTWARATLT